jgi:hypothetical protein
MTVKCGWNVVYMTVTEKYSPQIFVFSPLSLFFLQVYKVRLTPTDCKSTELAALYSIAVL